jgi:hypothetical protein
MGSGETASAPRSLQKEILDRTWTDLKSKEFDGGLIEKLAALAEEGRISHSTEVIAAIEGSVSQ